MVKPATPSAKAEIVENDGTTNGIETNESFETVVAEKNLDGLSEKELAGLNNFDALFARFGDEIRNIADVLGNGYGILDDKTRLVDQPFMVVKYGQHPSDKNGLTFSTLHCVTQSGEKLIVNDGSTGIHEQCKQLKEEYGNVAPLYVKRGLRVSVYDYTDEKTGAVTKAQTFYLNTGA